MEYLGQCVGVERVKKRERGREREMQEARTCEPCSKMMAGCDSLGSFAHVVLDKRRASVSAA